MKDSHELNVSKQKVYLYVLGEQLCRRIVRIDFPMITKQPSMCGGWLCPFTSKPRRIALNVNFEMLFSTYNKKKGSHISISQVQVRNDNSFLLLLRIVIYNMMLNPEN